MIFIFPNGLQVFMHYTRWAAMIDQLKAAAPGGKDALEGFV
jgi:hypothetical protein